MDPHTFNEMDDNHVPSSHQEQVNILDSSIDHMEPLWHTSELAPWSNIATPKIHMLTNPSQDSTPVGIAAPSAVIAEHSSNNPILTSVSLDMENTSRAASNDNQNHYTASMDVTTSDNLEHPLKPAFGLRDTKTLTPKNGNNSLIGFDQCEMSHMGTKWPASTAGTHASNSSLPIQTTTPQSPTSIVAATLATATLALSIVPVAVATVPHNYFISKSQSAQIKKPKLVKKANKQPRKLTKREAAKAATAAAQCEEMRLAHLAKTKQITDDELLRLKPKKKRRAARFDKPMPSRFCHICSRTPKSVRLAVCSKIKFGTCRKVICEKCFAKYRYGNFDNALDVEESAWLCPHCNENCPARAQCRTYQRINDRLRVSRLKQECPRRQPIKLAQCPSEPPVSGNVEKRNADALENGLEEEPLSGNQYCDARTIGEEHVQGVSSTENSEHHESMNENVVHLNEECKNMDDGQGLSDLLPLEGLIPPLVIPTEAVTPTSDNSGNQQASKYTSHPPQNLEKNGGDLIIQNILNPIEEIQEPNEVMPSNVPVVEAYDDWLWQDLNSSPVESFCEGTGSSRKDDNKEDIIPDFQNDEVVGGCKMLNPLFDIDDIRDLRELGDIGQAAEEVSTGEIADHLSAIPYLNDSQDAEANDAVTNDATRGTDKSADQRGVDSCLNTSRDAGANDKAAANFILEAVGTDTMETHVIVNEKVI